MPVDREPAAPVPGDLPNWVVIVVQILFRFPAAGGSCRLPRANLLIAHAPCPRVGESTSNLIRTMGKICVDEGTARVRRFRRPCLAPFSR